MLSNESDTCRLPVPREAIPQCVGPYFTESWRQKYRPRYCVALRFCLLGVNTLPRSNGSLSFWAGDTGFPTVNSILSCEREGCLGRSFGLGRRRWGSKLSWRRCRLGWFPAPALRSAGAAHCASCRWTLRRRCMRSRDRHNGGVLDFDWSNVRPLPCMMSCSCGPEASACTADTGCMVVEGLPWEVEGRCCVMRVLLSCMGLPTAPGNCPLACCFSAALMLCSLQRRMPLLPRTSCWACGDGHSFWERTPGLAMPPATPPARFLHLTVHILHPQTSRAWRLPPMAPGGAQPLQAMGGPSPRC